MITINESTLTPEESVAEHQKLANAMLSLQESHGWKLIEARMRSELELAYNAMLTATTGDMSLKASTAYTTLKAFIDAPKESAEVSIRRIYAIEHGEAVEKQDPPKHHRDGKGMTHR